MRNLIIHIMIVFIIFITLCKYGYSIENKIDSITFKHFFEIQTKIDANYNITKKIFKNKEIFNHDIFYMISDLRSRKNIELKVFKGKKIEWSTNLYFLNETSNGVIYLIEKTGTYNNNMWTIILKKGIVICTKQYLEISSGNIYINSYINKIESTF